MKLLVITREYPPHVLGGISYHLKNLYDQIAELGHNITIVSGKCGSADSNSGIKIRDDIDVQWVPFPTVKAHHLQFPLLAKCTIDSLNLSEFDAALTHTEYPFEIDLPVINKKHDCKQVSAKYSPPETVFKQIADRLFEPTRKIVDKYSISASDHIVYNSHLTKKKWEETYSFEKDSSVIYNGIDPALFYPRNITMEEDYLLFVGNSARKGISEVFSFALESPYPIYLVGPSNTDVPNTVGLGRLSQEELAEYYSGAVATIHPAKFEAFGNVILESLACGTPVIVSNQCGAAELIDETVGLILNNIKEGFPEIENMRQKDCVEKAQEYTWTRLAEKSIKLIEELS